MVTYFGSGGFNLDFDAVLMFIMQAEWTNTSSWYRGRNRIILGTKSAAISVLRHTIINAETIMVAH